MIGQQLNYKTLAEAVDIDQTTAKRWVQLLQGMGLIYLLEPFSNNALKRLAKTPKLYFLDSGLAASLSMWPSVQTLMNGPSNGHYFENFVVTELVKNYAYSQNKALLSYYRDQNAKEIDVIVEEGRSIRPFKIKKSANPDRRDVMEI